MGMKRECIGCLHRIKERDDDGRTWLLCECGYSMEETGVKCNRQEYEEDKRK